MTYVAAQIILWILAALVLGFALGWITNSRRGVRKKRSRRRF